MSRSVKLYLQDMRENLRLCLSFTESMSREDFLSDRKTFYAVVRGLEVVGEAAKKVPEEIRQRYSSIPWKGIAGMRDRLIHGYFGVNPDRVWRTLQHDVPRLLPLVEQVIRDLDEEPS